MKPISHILIAVLLSLDVVAAHADVTDTPSERQLSLPSANWKLALPREDWVITKEQRRAGDTAVYYALASDKRQTMFSVYIDKTTVCTSGATCLDSAMKNLSYKEAKDISRSDVGRFAVASFYLDEPQGYPVKQAHILAGGYFDGYWIDIHISKTGKERPEHAPLFEVLNGLTLKQP